MNESFKSFVELGKSLAARKDISWIFSLNAAGVSDNGWNLTEIIDGSPPNHFLQDLGQDNKALAHLNVARAELGEPALIKTAISTNWQDLIKAATCEQLLFRRNSTSHIVQNIIRPLRVLATVVENREPWQLTLEDCSNAFLLAKQIQASGKLADNILGVIKTVIDANHLAETCPLYPALSTSRLPSTSNRKSKSVMSQGELLKTLDSRKRSERLPEKKAFWELMRIIFTERPHSFTDAIRFNALKTMVLTGLRLGEVVKLPSDWARRRDYFDHKGRPASESGGYSSSLMLRHFAEKQNSENNVLFETVQYVPDSFVEILTEVLEDTVRITQPLRDTLKLQVDYERLLPNYGCNDLVPIIELYTVITGNPFWLKISSEKANSFIERYRETYNPEVLDELASYQKGLFLNKENPSQFNMAMYQFFNRLTKDIEANSSSSLKLRTSEGSEYTSLRKTWSEVFVRIDEMEEYLRSSVPTKLPDIKPLKHSNGEIHTWEFLFLTPKRALSEERNEGITDITQYFSTGMPDDALLATVLGDNKSKESLFYRYGKSEEDRSMILLSHSLRHLQNSELFRLGVADTIITKRFNRRSVAQSYEYDHRSLAEELDSVELPDGVEAALGDKSSTVAKLILLGRVSGPIVDAFKRIQREHGDDEAFKYLKVEADGFHATPYGFCINSFTVDPCPKNLECFAGCCHLTATNLPENRRNLERLNNRFQAALSVIQARPNGTIGLENQKQHAIIRLESVRKILATPSGERVFPDGPDFSKQLKRTTPQDE